MFAKIREDLRAAPYGGPGFKGWVAKLSHPGTQAVLVYRFGHWVLHFNVPVVRTLLVMVYQVLQYFVRVLIGVNIPVSAEIGGGFIIHTWSGVFVPCCRIGRNVLFQHGVNVHWDCQGIGDDVYFGPGCKVIRPVRIGSRVRIGANAVVLNDVPDDCTVVGIPGRVVERRRPARVPAAD